MLLYWKPVAEKMIEEQKKKVIKYFPNKDKFLAILFFEIIVHQKFMLGVKRSIEKISD